MPSVKISKTILGKVVTFTGFAKQSSETPLLLDFSSDDEKIGLSGKAEIRIDKDKIQMIDVDFEQADIDALQFGTKRGTGWLSFSYEDNWQIVGELDAGITLLGQYQFFDSSIKITGAVAQPEMTFAGRMNDENIVIDQREGNYFIRRNEQTLPVTVNNQPLQETILTLDKINQIQLAEAQALKEQQEKQAEEEQKKKTKDKKKLEIKPAEEPKPELAPPVAFKIEPVKLPEIKFAEITGNTALAGFIYPEPLVQVNQPCLSNITGQCWTAHGQGGQFSYNPAILPDYFLKLKDYEQVKQLKVALLNLNVQSITIQGKDKTAQKVILKGSTPDGQPVEVQLSVLGLE
jgi:hypothetical protein